MENWTILDFLVAGASIVAILAAVLGTLRWGRSILDAVRRRFSRFKPTIPRETLRAVPSRDNWWHMVSVDGLPAMRIATSWLVTNISDRPTIVVNASMSRGWLRRGEQARMLGRETIPVGATVETFIDFLVKPAFRKQGTSFATRLTLFDHLGNPHKTQELTIASNWRPKREEPAPAEEAMHAISNPIVKRVVAILKDEVIRYRECGRPVGGLGSVQVTYKNRTLAGIGYQGWEANSPRRQWIVPDPETAQIHSDNLDSLVEIFKKEDLAGRELITDTLIKRISSESEYAPIGYFFLLSLFRMGQLPAALQTIKSSLIDDKKFGFDEAVRMLSGLLQYEYPSFDSPALDKVERFMDGLDRPLHRLKERCIAARAIRPEDKDVDTIRDRSDM